MRTKSSPLLGLGIIAAVVIVPIALLLTFDPLSFRRVYVMVANMWLPVLLLIACSAAGVILAVGMNKGQSPRHQVIWPAICGIAVGVVLFGGFFFLRSWNVNNTYAELPTATEEQPDFTERVPYSVADQSANSAMSGINADRQHTKYLPGSNAYTTPATARGFITPGYEAVVQQNFDLDGTDRDTEQCSFSEDADRHMGGWWWHSLDRAIAGESRTSLYSREDAYSWCEDDTPYVAVPLTQYTGAPWNMHHVPAGVAVYDGETGEVEILDEVEDGELPGPAVSQSYAERVESAMSHRDNDGIWSVLLGQVGFQTPGTGDDDDDDEDSGEGDDPNADNPGNHQLGYGDGGSAHVTPLQRVSTSTAVEYVLTVDSGEVTAGEHPESQLRLIEPARESNPLIEQNIRGQFSDINWDSGITVQEITPGPDGSWVASIGQRTSVIYRVTMDTDGSWTIEDMRTGDEADVDELDDEEVSDDPEGSEAPSDLGDLPAVDEMTDEELRELGQMVIDELADRGES